MAEEADLTLQGDLDNQLVLKSIREMEEAAEKMAESGDQSFKDLAKSMQETIRILKDNRSELVDTGKTFQSLFSDEPIENLEDFRKGMTRLASDARQAATESEKLNEKGERLGEVTDRSTVSIWKMGTALDRVGVRGAGGMFRVVDAVKNIHPAAIAAVIALAGVLIVVKKITEAVVDLGKKAAKAFGDMVKDSVALAEQYETVELQLRNIFKGKVELAKQTVTRIAELSAKLGVDLSGRIAATFLPLVES
jgi:hypothetical protein